MYKYVYVKRVRAVTHSVMHRGVVQKRTGRTAPRQPLELARRLQRSHRQRAALATRLGARQAHAPVAHVELRVVRADEHVAQNPTRRQRATASPSHTVCEVNSGIISFKSASVANKRVYTRNLQIWAAGRCRRTH